MKNKEVTATKAPRRLRPEMESMSGGKVLAHQMHEAAEFRVGVEAALITQWYTPLGVVRTFRPLQRPCPCCGRLLAPAVVDPNSNNRTWRLDFQASFNPSLSGVNAVGM